MGIYAGNDRVIAIPGTGGGAATGPLLLENSVVVAKNGNDATGERNNWGKPFLTFAAAIAAAVAGDCIFVFPGTYVENLAISKVLNLHFFDGATLEGQVNVSSTNLTFRNARIVNTNASTGYCFSMTAFNAVLTLRDCVLVGAKDGIKRQTGLQDWRINLYNCDFNTVDDCLQFPVSGGDRGRIYAQDCRFKSLYQPAEMGNFNFHFRNCTFDNRLNTVVTNMGAIDCIPLPGQTGQVIGVVDGCIFLSAPDAVSTISRDNYTHATWTPTGAKYLFSNCQSNKPWSVNSDFVLDNCWENSLFDLV